MLFKPPRKNSRHIQIRLIAITHFKKEIEGACGSNREHHFVALFARNCLDARNTHHRFTGRNDSIANIKHQPFSDTE